MNNIPKNACQEIQLLEAYVSNQFLTGTDRQEIANHLEVCPKCRALASELAQYYSILEHEKKKPVSNASIKLMSDIEKDNVIIAGILLQPNGIDAHHETFKYQAEIVLFIKADDKIDVAELDCIPLGENEIFVRAIQSVKTNETTLFLYATDRKLYSNVQLKLESSDVIFLSDEIGKIEIGKINIEALEDQHLLITTKR